MPIANDPGHAGAPMKKTSEDREPMMIQRPQRLATFMLLGCAAVALAACDPNGQFDPDLRSYSNLGFDTSEAALTATANRPAADARGVISYPTYQVAVARKGETPATLAARVGVDAGQLARYNAVDANAVLNQGAVLALPSRVAEPNGAASSNGQIDITSLASNAIDRAEGTTPNTPSAPVAGKPAGPEPVRHKVARGETAYSIARYYNVSVRSLADWNGLPSDMSVREGQFLLIPTALDNQPPKATQPEAPGQGSLTPTPPSAAEPLPQKVPPKASEPVDNSPAPDLSASVSKSAGNGKLVMPVAGSIIRPYVKKKNDGIDIAASAGTPVKAADAGTVAAITKDTDQVPIMVLRHADGLLTVYANIDDITVQKGDNVSRGQTVAKVRQGDPSFLHFEVRQGYDSVDPVTYLD